MISLLEAKKNVPLRVKSVERSGRVMTDMRGRGGRRGMGRRNWCRRLSNLGIREGVIIKKLSVHPFFGPVIVRVGNCEIAVGRGMASTILVEEAGE
jgi:Fe2+ transport system protein FeoA